MAIEFTGSSIFANSDLFVWPVFVSFGRAETNQYSEFVVAKMTRESSENIRGWLDASVAAVGKLVEDKRFVDPSICLVERVRHRVATFVMANFVEILADRLRVLEPVGRT